MEPLLLKVNVPESGSFTVNKFSYQHFPGIWHFHPEYELTLILKSIGTRFVGDHVDQFRPGDLVFIGKNLPHTWKNDSCLTASIPDAAVALVVHFTEDFLGESFFGTPEMATVQNFLKKSKRGFKIAGKTKKVVIDDIHSLLQLSGAPRLLKLLHILCTLSESSDLSFLSNDGFSNYTDDIDCKRLNNVYEYVVNNFRGTIQLNDVAAIANLSPTAFSRYFKHRTRKSFSRFLIELKVGYACKLLMGDRYNIMEICYECGFRNLSNFNKQFKCVTQLTPKEYQRKYKPFLTAMV